jgi:hypothetical protein
MMKGRHFEAIPMEFRVLRRNSHARRQAVRMGDAIDDAIRRVQRR